MNRLLSVVHAEFGSGSSRLVFGHRPNTAVRVITFILVFGAVAGLAWGFMRFQQQAREHEAMREIEAAASRQLESMRQHPVKRVSPVSTHDPLRKRLAMVAAQINTPWPAIFDVLERGKSPKVAVIALEPVAQDGGMRLVLEGRSLEDVQEAADLLANQDEIERVKLVSHKVMEQHPNQPVRLTLDLAWRWAKMDPASLGVSR